MILTAFLVFQKLTSFFIPAYQFDDSFKVTDEMKAVYNYDGVIMVKYV